MGPPRVGTRRTWATRTDQQSPTAAIAASVKLSRRARQWELPGRVAKRLAEERPDQLVLPIPGRPQELPHLLAKAELVLALHGYTLDRTEKSYDATRGVQAYAVFTRRGAVGSRPTTGWWPDRA